MELVYYPHPALSAPTLDVEPGVVDDLEARIRRMFTIMYQNKGVGLAAPQVAWSVRLFVANPTGEERDESVFINPGIIQSSGRVEDEEGCLSFPGVYAKVLGIYAHPANCDSRRTELPSRSTGDSRKCGENH